MDISEFIKIYKEKIKPIKEKNLFKFNIKLLEDKEIFSLLNYYFKDVDEITEKELNKITDEKKVLDFLKLYFIQQGKLIFEDVEIKDYYKERRKPYTKEEEIEVFKRLKSGDVSARNEIVEHNYGLVVKIATEFYNNSLYINRLMKEDIIQNGFLGLFDAIDKFDLSYNCKFSTYATWWIWRSVNFNTTTQARMIRFPAHEMTLIKRVSSFIKKYEIKHDVVPTNEIISKSLDIPIDRVECLIEENKEVKSLDYELIIDANSGSIGTLGDILSDKDCNVEKEAIDRIFYNINEIKELALKVLSEKEFDVLLYRCGFYDGRVYTLEEIGKNYGLTRERIRQVEAKSLKKLRENNVFFERFNTNPNKKYRSKYGKNR